MEAFHRSLDYQRDLSGVVMDFFLVGFEDYRMKVLQKYPDMDLGRISLIDTPSTPPIFDSPPADDAEAPIAPIGEDDDDRD